MLWDVESTENPNIELKDALGAALISEQIVREAIENSSSQYLDVSLAHIEFTLAMIKIKLFYFNQTKESFYDAIEQLMPAIQNSLNHNSYEFNKSTRAKKEKDYRISNFINELPANINIYATLDKHILSYAEEILTTYSKIYN